MLTFALGHGHKAQTVRGRRRNRQPPFDPLLQPLYCIYALARSGLDLVAMKYSFLTDLQ
jgi:hypothetical protein